MHAKLLFCLALLLWVSPTMTQAQEAPTELHNRVAAAHGALREAIVANDAAARAALYRADAISMPDYQPALYGIAQIAAYHGAMSERRRVTAYVPVASEVFDLGETVIEIGVFTIAWQVVGGGIEEERGKYANVWSIEPDGALRLKADVYGYFRPLPDPAAFFVAMREAQPPRRPLTRAEQQLADTLQTRNERNAIAVQTYDAEAKIEDYADDAVIMPFADATRTGMDEIRPYLTAYTEAGRGVTFNSVRVWNVGFEDSGAHVIEYSKFRVDWQTADASGVVKGGGLRLWRRLADGSLELLRQIGTHDHVE